MALSAGSYGWTTYAALDPSVAHASADDIATMSLGDGASCALTTGGNARCWGNGDGETPASADDIELEGRAIDVQTNGREAFALLDTGKVRSWSITDSGWLGLEPTPAPATMTAPVEVELGGTAVQLAAGDDFACARLDDGRVRCWGSNDVGQLGQGPADAAGAQRRPADEGSVQLGGAAIELAAGAHHACAQLDSGQVRCWGLNDSGQLGYGHTEDIGDDEAPTEQAPVSLPGAVVKLVAGDAHTCALFETGLVQCWGANDAGQLGRGDTEWVGDDEQPSAMGTVPLGGLATELAAGARHTCAILTDGELICWGEGLDGRLGYGDEDDVGDDEVPAHVDAVELGGHAVSSLYLGPEASSTCARLDDQTLHCWGLDDQGQLGYGNGAPQDPTATIPPGHVPDTILVDDSDD